MILGLTGGYCAGKSTAAAILASRGWLNIEVDSMGHRALELALDEVVGLLGPSARDADGKPDRRAIGSLVFADPALMARYEAIVHPVMNRLSAQAVEAAGADARVLLNAAILYRLPLAASCGIILEVNAPLAIRLWRGVRRDRQGPRAALARIRAQSGLWSMGKALGRRVIRVSNSGGRAALERALKKAFRHAGLAW